MIYRLIVEVGRICVIWLGKEVTEWSDILANVMQQYIILWQSCELWSRDEIFCTSLSVRVRSSREIVHHPTPCVRDKQWQAAATSSWHASIVGAFGNIKKWKIVFTIKPRTFTWDSLKILTLKKNSMSIESPCERKRYKQIVNSKQLFLDVFVPYTLEDFSQSTIWPLISFWNL